MLSIHYTKRMRQDTKRMVKRGKNLSKLITVLNLLAARQPIPEKYHDHALKGQMKDFRECHIE